VSMCKHRQPVVLTLGRAVERKHAVDCDMGDLTGQRRWASHPHRPRD
jgi:hypothetical protein